MLNVEDGVPYITTPPIFPGKSRAFEFPLKHAGTYWYHSHTGLQQQRGIYGSIVIEPKARERVKADQEAVLVVGVARLVQRWLISYLYIPPQMLDVVQRFIPGLVLFYGIVLIDKLAPSRTPKVAEVWLAALGPTVLIWTAGMLLLLQAAHWGRFNALYGALGSVVAFLLLLYLSSCAGGFGVCLCAAQAKLRRRTYDFHVKSWNNL